MIRNQTFAVYRYLRCSVGIDLCFDWRGALYSILSISWAQIWVDYAQLYWYLTLPCVHWPSGSCLLPRRYLSTQQMVHPQGEWVTHFSFSSFLTADEQLAFRSALLYCGLLISNAFGSVRGNLFVLWDDGS